MNLVICLFSVTERHFTQVSVISSEQLVCLNVPVPTRHWVGLEISVCWFDDYGLILKSMCMDGSFESFLRKAYLLGGWVLRVKRPYLTICQSYEDERVIRLHEMCLIVLSSPQWLCRVARYSALQRSRSLPPTRPLWVQHQLMQASSWVRRETVNTCLYWYLVDGRGHYTVSYQHNVVRRL